MTSRPSNAGMSLGLKGPSKTSGQPVTSTVKRSSETDPSRRTGPGSVDQNRSRQSINESLMKSTFGPGPGAAFGTSPQLPKQSFTNFLVINFQATCDVHSKPQPEPREVIEFSATKVNGQTFAVEAIFHQYVSPKVNKRLTKFCTQLTGISQCMIDGQPGLDASLKKLHVWIHEQGLFKPGVTFATVTHGDWFLQQLLPKNLGTTTSSTLPEYFRKWIDISKIFQFRTGTDPTDELDPLSGMLRVFNLQLEGPRHSGIYVCHNIIQIMKALAAEKQCVFYINSP